MLKSLKEVARVNNTACHFSLPKETIGEKYKLEEDVTAEKPEGCHKNVATDSYY